VSANVKCSHGSSCYDTTVVDDDGFTACCGAYTSIFADDGVEYCKCCYGSVTGGAETVVYSVRPKAAER
jgi:hypothetical protein